MRLLSVFRKSLREQRRDLLGLSLVLIFAPAFVLLYRLFYPSGSMAYNVLVLNQDVGAQLSNGERLSGGDGVINAMRAVTYPDGSPLLVGDRVIGLYDILPPTHAVAAMNKVFTLGAGLDDVAYELIAMLVISLVTFAVGVWLFRRMQLKAQ